MTTGRREAMMTIALGGTAVVAGGAAAARPMATPRPIGLTHHVFFWLNNPQSAADRATLVAALKGLAAIEQIRGLHIGLPAPTEQRDVVDASYDVSELMFFDNAADQAIYQDHPLHRAFVEANQHLWRKVVVYDSIPA